MTVSFLKPIHCGCYIQINVLMDWLNTKRWCRLKWCVETTLGSAGMLIILWSFLQTAVSRCFSIFAIHMQFGYVIGYNALFSEISRICLFSIRVALAVIFVKFLVNSSLTYLFDGPDCCEEEIHSTLILLTPTRWLAWIVERVAIVSWHKPAIGSCGVMWYCVIFPCFIQVLLDILPLFITVVTDGHTLDYVR